MASWKRDVASGLVVLGPILVTLYVLSRVYGILAGLTPGFILDPVTVEPLLPDGVAGASDEIAQLVRIVVAVAVVIALTFAIGYLMRTAVGEFVERALDGIVNRIPGMRVVYNASKVATETALGEQESLQEPVKIETWEGHRMTAFKTGKTTEDGRQLVFLPTAPNITSGFVVEVEPERITELDESVEDALTRVLSAGFGDAGRDRGSVAGTSIDVVEESADGDPGANTGD